MIHHERKKKGADGFVSLENALSADIVTFHTPLTNNGPYPTHNLLGSQNFNLITEDTILINAARGGIIDEAIWETINTKANIIDCWENEPNINRLFKSQRTGLLHILLGTLSMPSLWEVL